MKSPDEITLLIPKKCLSEDESARFIDSDHIAGVLGEFPELTKAVRAGDLAEISSLCAQLFDLNSATKLRPQPTSVAS